MSDTKIAIFRNKKIRKTIHNNEWWFSVVDVVEVLTGTDRPRKYWNDLKTKLIREGYTELSEKIGQLKLKAQREYQNLKVMPKQVVILQEEQEKSLRSVLDTQLFLKQIIYPRNEILRNFHDVRYYYR